VHLHDSSLKAYLRGSFPSVRDIDDVVQESYLRVWKARASQPIKSAKGFLFTVARRLALDLIRRERRSPLVAVTDLDRLFILDQQLRISGIFRADNPEGFVRIVEASFELKAERRNENEIVLRRP